MRIHKKMIESELTTYRTYFIYVLIDGFDVFVTNRSWIDLYPFVYLKSLKLLHIPEPEVDFLIIKYLKTENILSLMPEFRQI